MCIVLQAATSAEQAQRKNAENTLKQARVCITEKFNYKPPAIPPPPPWGPAPNHNGAAP